DDYRNRHAQYKTDPLLQAAHAAFPWLVTWDDHELEDNCAGEISAKGLMHDAFMQLRATAYKVYFEHMPLRRSSLPNGPYMQLYRRIAFGRLAEFDVLDTRQYRTDQACGDGTKPPCGGELDPQATLLGDKQEAWLLDGLGSRTVATEFVGTSISSGGDGAATSEKRAAVVNENPFVKFHNGQRGYVRCEATPQQWRTDFQIVPYVKQPGAPLETAASFVVE